MNQSEYFDHWCKRIRLDVAPFVDPGTELALEESRPRSLRLAWRARGRPEEASIRVDLSSGVRVTFEDLKASSYHSFLAHPRMGDLLAMAKSIILLSGSPGIYVDAPARRTDVEDAVATPGIALLQQLLAQEERTSTRLLMITGDAGSGKTRLLREIARRQAERYVNAADHRLLLYIDAQGRALSRFKEALATELQDLGALVRYHAIPALVRNDLIVPVIDGFDELIGTGGFDDAFNSLTGFLQELDGAGQVVASARSTYYQQEFAGRADRVSALGTQSWEQVSVKVADWTDTQVNELVTRTLEGRGLSRATAKLLKERLAGVFEGRNKVFRKKPFFVAKALGVLLDNDKASLEGDLLRALLEREANEKLLQKSGEAAVDVDEVLSLMRLVAEEMWNLETRELDADTVREIAQVEMSRPEIASNVKELVAAKLPKFAALTPGKRPESVSFEHEVYFSALLADVLKAKMQGDEDALRVFLGRSAMPREVAEEFSERLLRENTPKKAQELQPLFDKLANAGARIGVRSAQIQENGGLILLALLRALADAKVSIEDLTLSGVVIPGGDLGDAQVHHCRLHDLEFRRTYLGRARFTACSARKLKLTAVGIARKGTVLDITGVDPAADVHALRVIDTDHEESVFAPNEIAALLSQCGMKGIGEDDYVGVDSTIVHALDRLSRAYLKSNPVCVEDPFLRTLFEDRRWPRVQRLLVTNGIVTEESRQTGGSKKTFLRRQVLPDVILSGQRRQAAVPTAVRVLWTELEKAFPKAKG